MEDFRLKRLNGESSKRNFDDLKKRERKGFKQNEEGRRKKLQ
jgi:hypothetical protein